MNPQINAPVANNDENVLFIIAIILCLWTILLVIFSIRVAVTLYQNRHIEFVQSKYLEVSNMDGLWLIRKTAIAAVHVNNDNLSIIYLTNGKEISFSRLSDPNELLHAVCSRKE